MTMKLLRLRSTHSGRCGFRKPVSLSNSKRCFAGFPGVDGQYQQTSKENRSNISVDLNKNSKLRAIFISVDVLTGSDTILDRNAKSQEESANAAILNEDLDAIKKEKEKRHNKTIQIEGITDVSAKYMSKLKSKLQGRTPGAAREAMANSGSRGDSGLLMAGRMQEAEKSKAVAGGWMLVSGMGALLDYCSHRTMQVGTLLHCLFFLFIFSVHAHTLLSCFGSHTTTINTITEMKIFSFR